MDGIIIIIKKLRKFRKITQETMAETLHLSLRAYQKIESGQTKLDMDRLEQIAVILETSLIDLVNAKNRLETIQNKENSPFGTDIQNDLVIWTRKVLELIIESKRKEIFFLQEKVELGVI